MTRSRQRRRPALVLATHNVGKAREIAAILARLPLELHGLEEWPEIRDLPEDAHSYAANAATKARATAAATGLIALADDSGLEIDALAGAPGPHSRRFLGDAATDRERTAHVLALLADVPDDRRTARYRAAVAVAHPMGDVRIFHGTCEGAIARSPRGRHGFGYDPIFVVAEDGRTMAELPPAVKNRISHRARALRAAETYLYELEYLGGKEGRRLRANSQEVPGGPVRRRRARAPRAARSSRVARPPRTASRPRRDAAR